ncbi:hypothetical protein M472_18035 [Sphingobacterium paucimobilis HER1398]|uniref:Uncharacterized protein n=2 Tax=Sphingobacterium TaxID=28453 RepID=U2HZH2_9SPHI|nr:hypothetical protein M472_18035 [Sphingobacterium paucimobilis HER1398]
MLLSINLCKAQGATLTKDETLKYIGKKIDESKGYKDKDYITYLSIALGEANINFSKVVCPYRSSENKSPNNRANTSYVEHYYDFIFNPVFISSITNVYNADQNVSYVRLHFNSKTVKCNYYFKYWKEVQVYRMNYDSHDGAKSYEYDYVDIPYLTADPTNFDKIKKAFEHLKTLSKVEDDPFG